MKLPFATRATGDVTVEFPLASGSTAHRIAYYNRPATKEEMRRDRAKTRQEAKPACHTEPPTAKDRYSVVSGGWADKHGAVACTREACYQSA